MLWTAGGQYHSKTTPRYIFTPARFATLYLMRCCRQEVTAIHSVRSSSAPRLASVRLRTAQPAEIRHAASHPAPLDDRGGSDDASIERRYGPRPENGLVQLACMHIERNPGSIYRQKRRRCLRPRHGYGRKTSAPPRLVDPGCPWAHRTGYVPRGLCFFSQRLCFRHWLGFVVSSCRTMARDLPDPARWNG